MREVYERKMLSEVCQFVRGPFGGHLRKDCFVDEGFAVYEQQHAIYNQFDDIRYFVNPAKFEQMKRFELLPGDVIMSCSGTMGKVAIVPEGIKRGIINQALLKLSPKPTIDVSYLRYWMDSYDFQESISKHSKGAAIKNVASVQVLKSILFPYISLSQQKRIVSILDECFAAIDQAKANVEKNITNALELFRSESSEIFRRKGDSWIEAKLKDITTKIGSGATPNGGQSNYKESGISLIRSMNVHDNGFREKNLAFIDDAQAEELRNVTLQKGDILLNITGASVARCCIVPEYVLPARVNQHVSIIRLKENIMGGDYLHYALTSDTYKKVLLGIGEQGSTRQAITKLQIEDFIISFPPEITAQQQIVCQLKQLSSGVNKLVQAYLTKLTALDELKKTILQKAFTGELTKTIKSTSILEGV